MYSKRVSKLTDWRRGKTNPEKIRCIRGRVEHPLIGRVPEVDNWRGSRCSDGHKTKKQKRRNGNEREHLRNASKVDVR